MVAGYQATERGALDQPAPAVDAREISPPRWTSRAVAAATLLSLGVVAVSRAAGAGDDAAVAPASSAAFARNARDAVAAVADGGDDDGDDLPAPSTSGRGTHHKRGSVCNAAEALAGDLDTLSGVGWHYSWTLEMPGAYEHDHVQQEFVPMVWGIADTCYNQGRGGEGGSCLADLDDFVPLPTTTAILGFNEPNFRLESNLTAIEACKAWPKITKFAKKYGLRVGAPAVGDCTYSSAAGTGSECWIDSNQWLEEFFAECGLDSVDFIPTHRYGCNSTALLDYVKDLNKRFSKPVWLTEFSCSSALAEQQLAFQKIALPALDALPDTVLERYAWFATHTNHSTTVEKYASLMYDYTPRNLTKLGKYYNGGHNATTGEPTDTAPKDRVIGGSDDVNLDDVLPQTPPGDDDDQ